VAIAGGGTLVAGGEGGWDGHRDTSAIKRGSERAEREVRGSRTPWVARDPSFVAGEGSSALLPLTAGATPC